MSLSFFKTSSLCKMSFDGAFFFLFFNLLFVRLLFDAIRWYTRSLLVFNSNGFSHQIFMLFVFRVFRASCLHFTIHTKSNLWNTQSHNIYIVWYIFIRIRVKFNDGVSLDTLFFCLVSFLSSSLDFFHAFAFIRFTHHNESDRWMLFV